MPGKVFIHYVLPSAISGAYYWECMGGKNIFTQGLSTDNTELISPAEQYLYTYVPTCADCQSLLRYNKEWFI